MVSVCRVTEILVGMGYSRAEIEESLSQAKYDDIFATYLLLGRKSNDVSVMVFIRAIKTQHTQCSLSDLFYHSFCLVRTLAGKRWFSVWQLVIVKRNHRTEPGRE